MAKENENKSEKSKIYDSIWNTAEKLRGSVDGWDFKQYVLGFMFYRFISENITEYINKIERKAGNSKFSYADLDDSIIASDIKEDIIRSKGFFIYPSELFINVVKKASSDENLNETLSNTFKNIENSANGHQSEDDFVGLFDDIEVNSKKLGRTVDERNKKLVSILNAISSIKLGNYYDNTIDLFGDAYEYMMSMYASKAGKSGGEFFTPQEVSELLTRIATVGRKKVNKVYDPACGSGSLLLQAIKVLGKDNVKQGFYGQEINLTNFNLCRINMFLHNIEYDKFSICYGDTLMNPLHLADEPFDLIVSNPPYSLNWEGDSNPLLINDKRFSPAGVLAPKGNADFAFIMHIVSCLSTDGVAAIVCFPGVMYRSGNEQKIRKYLVDNNFVDAIIQLPANLFFGPNISVCILVLKKSRKDTNILFIDASNEFIKPDVKNSLSPENIKNIIEYYTNRGNIEYISKLASYEEVKNKSYNLSVQYYIEKAEVEKCNIDFINEEIVKTVKKIDYLRSEINNIIATLSGDENE